MIDINMLKPLIHNVFQGSGSSMLSKSAILSKLTSIPQAQQFLPFLKQVPDRNDYTENSFTQEAQNAAQKQASPISKIREKVGI